MRVDGLPGAGYELRHRRVDAEHNSIAGSWAALGDGDWPDETRWQQPTAADRLEELDPTRAVTPADGTVHLDLDLPMPSTSYFELTPLPRP
ncbi:hypothetical protein [Micromonospora sp. NPDC092111]|uniref:hypothetical protein n=1 Tax=Micromonospora sp. NPDC092111 TaxID=3364289 RepID=UPI003821E527